MDYTLTMAYVPQGFLKFRDAQRRLKKIYGIPPYRFLRACGGSGHRNPPVRDTYQVYRFGHVRYVSNEVMRFSSVEFLREYE